MMKEKIADRKINIRELFFVMLSLFLPLEYGISLLEQSQAAGGFIFLAVAAVLGVLLMIFYYFWYRNFGNLTLQEIFARTFGKVVAKVILAVYLLAFWAVIIDFAYALAYVWGAAINIPTMQMLAAALALVALIAMTGHTVVSRLANFLVFLALCFLLIGIVLVLARGDMSNLAAYRPAGGLSVFLPLSYGFAITFGLAMFALPFLRSVAVTVGEQDFDSGSLKEKKLRNWLIASVLTGAVFLALLMLRNLIMLGSALPDYDLPLLQTLKLFSLGESFNQTEIFGILLFESIGVVGLAFAFCSINKLTAELVPVKSNGSLTVAWAVLTYLAALVLFAEPQAMTDMLIGCANSAVWLAAVIIPLITLLTDKIRKH